jgi:O-antigen ligase
MNLAAAQTEIGLRVDAELLPESSSATNSVSSPWGRISKRLDAAIAAGLLMVVVFTALAHGAVEPWSAAIFELIVIGLVFLWGIKVVVDKRLSLKIPTAALPLAVLAVVGLAQSIAFTDAGSIRKSLSMDVESTRGAVTAIVILLASCLLAANFFSTRKRAKFLSHFLVIFGFGMALFAIVQNLSWNGRFYWLRYNTVGTSPFGSFVNHNNFAGYMEMLFPIPVGLIITHAIRAETRIFYGFAAALMAVAIMASLSRGGMISLACGGILMLVLGPMAGPKHASTRVGEKPKRKDKAPRGVNINGRPLSFLKAGLVVICISSAIAVGTIWMGSDTVGTRLTGPQAANGESEQETFYTSRGWIWRDTARMIKAKPITGVGLGAFATAYPIYSRSDGTVEVDRAHNDYLQILAECGLLGGVIALWFILLMGRAVMRGIASPDRLLSGLALGAGAGIFSLLVHSIFDFNLQLPSNALLFLLLSAQVSLIGAGLIRAEKKQSVRSSRRPGLDGTILQTGHYFQESGL